MVLAAKVIHSGYLKQRRLFSNWSKYYFVLTTTALLRYRNPPAALGMAIKTIESNVVNKNMLEEKEEKEIILSDAFQIIDATGLSGKKFSFALLPPGKSPIILRAKTAEEVATWMMYIQRVITPLSRPNSSRSMAFTSSPVAISEAENAVKRSIGVFEAVVDAVVLSDEKGGIVGFNKAAEQLFGYTKEEAIGQSVNILMPPAFARYHDRYLENYSQTKSKKLIGVPRTVKGMRKDGSYFSMTICLGEVSNTNYFVAVFKSLATTTNMFSNTSSSDSSDGSPRTAVNTEDVVESRVRLDVMLGNFAVEFKNKLKQEYIGLSEKNDLTEKHVKEAEEQMKNLMTERNVAEAHARKMRMDVFYLTDEVNVAKVLTREQVKRFFLEFCKKEKCDEELHFFLDATAFRKKYATMNYESPLVQEQMQKDAQVIYKTYIHRSSSKEINTSSGLVKILDQKLEQKDIDPRIFYDIGSDVLVHVLLQPFKKFIQTKEGRAAVDFVVAVDEELH